MKWEVFKVDDGKVLTHFKRMEDADAFIAAFDGTNLGQGALQLREVNAAATTRPILRIVRGQPGAGKSTFASKHFPGVFHIENDMFLISGGEYKWSKERVKEAISLCTKMVRTALANSSDVVVANTFTKCRFIQFYKNLANEYGAEFEVYRCHGDFKNVHGLSDKMVENFKNAMEDWPGEVDVWPNM